jgi:hypothetical protein
MRTGSYVQARFQGQQEHEFTWFALGSTLPLISRSIGIFVMVFLAHALNGRDPTHGTLKLSLDAVFDSGDLSPLLSPERGKALPHDLAPGLFLPD